MNKLQLLGRLVRDPEAGYSQSGTAITKFTIAVGRPYRKDHPEEADFIPCTAFGKTAETIGNYFAKGNRILIDGSIRFDSYDGKDGKKHYYTYALVNNFEFIDTRKQNDGIGGNNVASGGNGSGFENMGSAQDFQNIPF